MKILLASDSYRPAVNGVVTSMIALKKALEDLGHEVRVLILAKEGYIDHAQNVYAVSSININKVYPGARVKFFNDYSILKQITLWEPDLIHTQSEFSVFRMAKYIAQYLDIPIVHTYHTIYEDYTHYFSPSKRTGRKIVATLTKKRLDDVEVVIAPTPKVATILENYEISQAIETVPTGIQLEKFQHTLNQNEQTALRNRYNIPNDAFLLLSLGRLGKEKNVEELLRFLAMIRLDVYFLIVGDGPNRKFLMTYAEELGLADRVIFTGMVDPKMVPLYYQTADLFMSASSSETQGLTYLEALASGLPALCRADEAIENVILNGYNGYQYHSFKAFESCLYFLMHNSKSYQKMATNAQEHALKHFSSTIFGERIDMIYRSALESYYTKQMMQYY